MALSLLRSCVNSRLTTGVSRHLIVLESKVTCRERHAPGAEFLMMAASKIRPFSSLTRRMRTRFNTLYPPVIEEFTLGSHIVSLEMIDDEKNHGSMLCHMDGTTVRSNIIMSHDKHKDDNFLQVYYDETRYGERWRSHNPTDREIICSHLIERSIRPLFTAGFPANVMVNVCVLKTNWKHEADAELMAIIATSAALMKLNTTRAKTSFTTCQKQEKYVSLFSSLPTDRRSLVTLLYAFDSGGRRRVSTRRSPPLFPLVYSLLPVKLSLSLFLFAYHLWFRG